MNDECSGSIATSEESIKARCIPAKSMGVRSLARLRVRLPGPISPSGIELAGELARLLDAVSQRDSIRPIHA